MTNAQVPGQPRLDAALAKVAATFRRSTTRRDEINCTCHWGTAKELRLVKRPNVKLDADLLRRTWEAPDWKDHPAVLRRILPQFAADLAQGLLEPGSDPVDIGYSFARGKWQLWPAKQTAAVQEFFSAWWSCSLTDPEPAMPVHDVFTVCVEASGTVGPWLGIWEALDHPVADQHLAELAERWESYLRGGQLPWRTWIDRKEPVAELAAWLVRHAPDRLRAYGAAEELLHRVRLLGLGEEDRWQDPHWYTD